MANPNARTHDLDLRSPIQDQIEWLLRKKALCLMTSPSNAAALAYAISPAQASKLDLRLIFAVGERVLPTVRKIVEERLGVKIAAIYSCEEVGTIACQCPATDGYHVVSENVLVEIIRDNGAPAGPGEMGQVVLTSYYNYAMPFIRYAIGDIAEFSGNLCQCGRKLSLISQVLGRTRNAFLFKDGTRIWPRSREARAFHDYVPYREFQMIQHDFEHLKFRYIPTGTGDPDPIGLAEYVKNALHSSAKLSIIAVETIPRGPGGKLDPFVSMLNIDEER